MMPQEPMQYVSEAKLEELRQNVSRNLERYATGDFADLERDNGWAIEAGGVAVDRDLLASLDGTVRTAEGDRAASLTLYRALPGMTPALAREERVWVRLSHIECLGYARFRWPLRPQWEQAGSPGSPSSFWQRFGGDPRRQCTVPPLVEHACCHDSGS